MPQEERGDGTIHLLSELPCSVIYMVSRDQPEEVRVILRDPFSWSELPNFGHKIGVWPSDICSARNFNRDRDSVSFLVVELVITRCRYQRRLLFKVRERLGREGGARGEEKEEEKRKQQILLDRVPNAFEILVTFHHQAQLNLCTWVPRDAFY